VIKIELLSTATPRNEEYEPNGKVALSPKPIDRDSGSTALAAAAELLVMPVPVHVPLPTPAPPRASRILARIAYSGLSPV
jgi:hypothetical protein